MDIGDNLNPVVLLKRLTDEEINYYTTFKPKRRSGRKRKEKKSNLKDEQQVDFSFFEEYRRSRNSYLKKEEKRKKGIKLSTKSKPEQLVPNFQIQNVEQSNFLDSSILVNNDTNKVNVTKEKKEKKKRKDPSQKKSRCKKPRMKFKRMVIESDSDCSVENYGIVYANDSNIIQLQQQQHTTNVNIFSSAISPSPLPFQNCVSSPTISPPCSEVIVNEHDILSALDCESEDVHYSEAIKKKLATCKERNLLDILSGSTDDNMEFMSWVNSETSVVTPLQITSSISAYDSSIETKDSSDDVVKESTDLVSEIMKDMDREFENRKKKVSASVKSPEVENQCDITISSVQLGNVFTQHSNQGMTDPCDKLKIITKSSSDLVQSSEQKEKKASTLQQFHTESSSAASNDSDGAMDEDKECIQCHTSLKSLNSEGNICNSCKLTAVIAKPIKKAAADNNTITKIRRKAIMLSPGKSPFLKRNRLAKKKKLPRENFRLSVAKKMSFQDRAKFLNKSSLKKYHMKDKPVPDVSTSGESCNTSESETKIGCQPVSSSNNQGIKTIKFSNICSILNIAKSAESEKQPQPGVTESTSKSESLPEEGGFVMKPIKKGLLLMSVPDPDKELDLAIAEKTHVEETCESENLSNNSNRPSDKKEEEVTVSPSTLQKINYKYVLPDMPIQIVAHYAKDKKGSDFLLSGVSYVNNSDSQSTSNKALMAGDVSVSTLSNSESSAISKKNSENSANIELPAYADAIRNRTDSSSSPNISVTILPKPIKDMNSSILNNLSQESSMTVTVLPKSVEEINSSSPISKQPVIIENTSEDLTQKSSSATETASKVQHAKTTKTKSNKPDTQPSKTETDSTSLVLHELDAIAILSILDLDGNEQHASNLLENLFVKELEELQKIKHVYHETTEKDIKTIADMKCKAKLSRIKSLSIARALLKKYGKLSKVVEAVINTPSENLVPYDSVSATVEDPQLPFSFSPITKVEKNRILSDCRLAQQKSVEMLSKQVLVPNVVNNAAPVNNSITISNAAPVNNPTTTPSIENSPPVCIKPEKGTTSRSCLLSELLISNKSQLALPQVSITNQSSSTNAVLPSDLSNVSITALVPIQSSNHFGRSTLPSSINTPVSNSYQLINHNSNTPAVSVPSTVVKGEGRTIRPSCQLQNSLPSSQLQIQPSISQHQAPVTNQFSVQLQSLQGPQINSLVSIPMQMQQPVTNLQYKALVPVQRMMASVNNSSCPNVTVPFSMSNPMQPISNNRSLVPMNFVQRSNPPANALLRNPLQVRHVVLSNVPAPNNQQQTSFAVTPYNYVPPQPVASNALVPVQPMNNMYATYQPLHSVSNSAQTMSQVNAVPIHKTSNDGLRNLLMDCFVCKSPASMRCKQCAQVVYCSTECAKIYWHQRHKMECQAISNIT